MNVKIVSSGGELTAVLSGEIDHHTARDIRREIDSNAEKLHPPVLRLNFEGVQFMDSSGIGLIMGRYRLMQLLGGRLLVTNIPSHLRRIMDLSGVGALGVLEYKGKDVKK